MIHKKRLFYFHNVIVFALTALSFQAVQAQSEGLKQDLNKELKTFSLITISPESNLRQSGSSKTLDLSVEGRELKLELTPHDLRSAGYHAEDTGANGVKNTTFGKVNTYKGVIVGDESSSVRLSIDGTTVEGYIFSATDRFFVEPAAHFSKAALPDQIVVYRAADLLHHDAVKCDAHISEKLEASEQLIGRESILESTSATYRVLEIATEADLEFVNVRGGAAAANADIMNTLNMIDGVYKEQLGLAISVVYQHTWSTADPFAGANTDIIVRNFQAYWNANFPQTTVSRDTAHLFSAKSNIDGQAIAFNAVICNNPNASYGLTGKFDYTPTKYELTAHEIGHNLSATHVDSAQGCANTVMNALLSTETPFVFCAQSRSEIRTHVANNGTCLASRNSAATRFDFDGDNKADIGVFRPSNGAWYIYNSSNSAFNIFVFGQSGDKPVAEDYDGDGKADAAVYRNGDWYKLKSSTGTFEGVGFGNATDIPTPGDFDGDGKVDVAVYRRGAQSTLYYLPSSAPTALRAVAFGIAEDIPVMADYDGDGKADIAVFRPSSAVWYRYNSSNGAFVSNQFGLSEDLPQIGDFDADGKSDITIFRPSNGAWYTLLSANNNITGVIFGASGDKPVPADYDGDGKADVAVYRPANGYWYRLNSTNGSFQTYPLGDRSDLPVENR
jgi:hypothetical protein